MVAVNDSFGYNNRSELVNATVNNGSYGYAYDNIGNRETAQELTDTTAYATNALNQYTAITESEATPPFAPNYDAAGNQTKVKTATGIWNVAYNAENRPVQFTSEDGTTVIDCAYDYMGRRVSKKVTVNNSVTQHLRFIYCGYLQIAAYDVLTGNFQWFILWDPTEPIASRPLAIRKDGAWYAYGIDLTKNVCELFDSVGTIATRYDYTPFGEVTPTGNVTQPIQWSSEFNDEELGLVYYNYRHYNPTDGRWINRDPIAEKEGYNLYGVVGNKGISVSDNLGLWSKENILKKICCSKYKEYIKLIKDYKIISFDSIYLYWVPDESEIFPIIESKDFTDKIGGMHDSIDKTIHLNSKLNDNAATIALFHEILHAVFELPPTGIFHSLPKLFLKQFEEIYVYTQTEQFAIDLNFHPTYPNARIVEKGKPKVNFDFFRIKVLNSETYNPNLGLRNRKPSFDGEKNTGKWECKNQV